jgi:hypothetical protein
MKFQRAKIEPDKLSITNHSIKSSSLLLFLVLASLSINLSAQEIRQFNSDTVILRTGGLIPCIVVNDFSKYQKVKLVYAKSNGEFELKEIPLTEVQSFSIHSSQIERGDALSSVEGERKIKLYVGIGGGFPRTVGISANFLYKNDLGGSISFKYAALKSADAPSDYRPGLFLIPFETPRDEVTCISFCFVKAFSIPMRKRMRFGMEAGPSIVKYSYVHFAKQSSLLGPNYRTWYDSKVTAGLALRLKMEFPVTRFFGFEVAATGNINPIKSFACFEFYLTFGKVRD